MQINKVQLRFILIFIVGYFLFDYFFKFWIGLCAPGGVYWAFAEEHLNFIRTYRHFLIWGTGIICDIFGLMHISNDTAIRIIGHGGIKIVYSCLGYGIISILMALSIAVPHQKVAKRLVFLVLSMALLTLLNIMRLFVVSYYARQAYHMKLDHHLLFNILCYLLILLGMYCWMKNSAANQETRTKKHGTP